ncbi:MAG: hypothetical protein ABSC37_04505 [Xanthobacteraceae bacterium]
MKLLFDENLSIDKLRSLVVMAGLVPAIHVFLLVGKGDVDARDERGHDELNQRVV